MIDPGVAGALAHSALSRYPLGPASPRFLRHNENLTFRVDARDNERYLLRIHIPVSANFGGERFGRNQLESELQWLSALSRDTELHGQRPIRDRDGGLVTTVKYRGREWPCTALTWIEAQPYKPSRSNAATVGAMIRDLHEHARKWVRPPRFVRPSYDSRHFSLVLAQVHSAIDLGFLSSNEFALLERAATETVSILEGLQQDEQLWGLIHSDLGPGNILMVRERAVPIDFCLCGFGPFVWDLAGAMLSQDKAFRQPLIEGYGRLPAQSERAIEACGLLSIAACYAFHMSNPAQHDWLARRMPRSVNMEWRRFLAGESFVYDL